MQPESGMRWRLPASNPPLAVWEAMPWFETHGPEHTSPQSVGLKSLHGIVTSSSAGFYRNWQSSASRNGRARPRTPHDREALTQFEKLGLAGPNSLEYWQSLLRRCGCANWPHPPVGANRTARYHVISDVPAVAHGLDAALRDHPLEDGCISPFSCVDRGPRSIRRWLDRRVMFRFDADVPFNPFTADPSVPAFEWADELVYLSIVISPLTIHAAVVEKDGAALILPAPARSGKSTCAQA